MTTGLANVNLSTNKLYFPFVSGHCVRMIIAFLTCVVLCLSQSMLTSEIIAAPCL